MEHVLHILAHGTLDSLKILPFLFITYLLMELLEHKAGDRVQRIISRAGKAGPAIGGALGLAPQCGFSAMAAGLYAGHIITPGTLLAVFLATSDEMLPIFIGAGVAPSRIFTVLGLKLGCALIVGFVTDLLLRKHIHGMHISELCEDEHCHCEKGIWRSAIYHTLQVGLFLYLITVVLTGLIETLGEESIADWFVHFPVVGPIVAALVGLIPNCASSVVLTSLYMEGVLSSGAMLSGLMVNAGIGLAILFRNNRPVWDSFRVLLILWSVSVVCGILIDVTPLGAWLY